MDILLKLIGALGLIAITYGIFAKNEIQQDWIFVLGGSFLLIYSISLRDPIFIPLQIVFISASLYEICKIKHTRKSQLL